MHVQQAIRSRRAIRNFTEESIAEDVIRSLLEAAVWAPSALNSQPWAFVVVQDRKELDRLNSIAINLLMQQPQVAGYIDEERKKLGGKEYDIFHGANTLVLVCAKPGGLHTDWDCCLAGENLMLAAREMGVGSCVIGLAWSAMELDTVKAELEIPKEYRVILPIILGYASETPPELPRKPPEILSWTKSKVMVTQ